MKKVTLDIIEGRSKKAEERYPDLPKCGVLGCERVVDATPGLGLDTSCAYHRLLFDHWLYDVDTRKAMSGDTEVRRAAFANWVR